MPTTVKIRRSGTASATPSALEHGEIAINYADGKVFWKNASNVITSFTFQSYALASHTHSISDVTGLQTALDGKASSSHTHAASDITSGTLDAARLPLATTGAAGAVIVGTGLGVSSGTVSVTYGTSNTSACRGDDSRLSDTRTPTDGSVTTAKIANDAVTYAKIQNVSATDRLLGRSSAGAGDVEEITCTSFGRSLISSADAPAARTTLGVQPTASPTFTGTATLAAGAIVTSTAANSGLSVGGSSKQVRLSFAPSEGTAPTSAVTGTAYIVSADFGSGYTAMRFEATEFVFAHGIFASEVSTTFKNNGDIVMSRGKLLVTAGSGSSGSYKPGMAISGDDDTGVQQVGGANTLSVVTAGNERLRVTDSRVFINGNGEQYGLGVRYVSTGGAVHFGATSNSASPDAAISNAGGGTLMLLKNDGEVLVGGTTDQGAYNLQCNGTGVWGAGAYVNGSDERIKDDIAPLSSCTDVIESLRPVTFRYKESWSKDQSIQPGFIAQDLQQALAGQPYLDGVVQQGTEYLSVAYQTLIPLLVKALQESNARIAALEERING
jgi:hypothetical protein